MTAETFNRPTLSRGTSSTRARTITCIINAGAGSSRSSAERAKIETAFEAHGLRPEMLLADHGEDIPELAAEAARRGSDTVVAGGGDGTINAVASGLIGTGSALGVLPLGTLNHFAQDAGIPLALDQAVETISVDRTLAVDVGEVNGRIFLNNSSLGLYPRIVRKREREQRKGTSKWHAFAVAAAAVLKNYPVLRFELTVDGKRTSRFEAPLLFIGNNKYTLGGGRLGARERLDSGLLWLCRAPPLSRSQLLRNAVTALFAGDQATCFETFEGREVSVETDAANPTVAMDGEVCRLTSPLHYRCRPRALTVIVPPAEPQSR
jgi:diacylglycerol kinase family enzyme